MTKKYKADRDEISRTRFYLRLRMDRSYARIVKRDITEQFTKLIENTVNPAAHYTQMRNLILSVYGETGSGKSNSIMAIGKRFFPHFSHKNVFFYDQEIIEKAHEFPRGTLIIRDENPARAIYGVGSQRIPEQVGVMIETCRKHGLNIALVEPSFTENPVTKFYLETFDMDPVQRISRLGVRDPNTKMFIGGIFVKAMDEDDPDWIEYGKKKDAFIEDIKRGRMSASKLNYDQIVSDIIATMDPGLYLNKAERKAHLVQRFPTWTTGEIRTLSDLLEVAIRNKAPVT